MSEKLEKIISDYTTILPPYQSETSLQNELGINSFIMVKLIVAIEDAFGIEFDLDVIDKDRLMTVGDLLNILRKYDV
ncbi:MAG: hypothetical protein E7388_02825 [Ruminococcaceae bacterium]|nr:hypothetical protein [Oscillospiraceae bacterium]